MQSRVLAAAVLLQAVVGRLLSSADLQSLYPHTPRQRAAIALRTPKDATQSLRDAAAARGIFIGSSSNFQELTNSSDPLYSTIAAQQFSVVTAEVECKWKPTEPDQSVFNYSLCDYMAQYAVNNSMAHRVHNLAWGNSNPSWLVNPMVNFSDATLQSFLAEHVSNMVQHYAASGYCTDVVNEAISDSSNSSVIFKPADPWYPSIPNYVFQAFTTARAADPAGRLKLFYNEYGAEGLGTKSDKVYALMQNLTAAGLVDGVGMQMHISVDSYPDPQEVSSNMARLVALGLEVHITEMDVRCTPPCGSDRLALQAQIYGDMLQACLNNTRPTAPSGKGGCKSVETWGFTDRYTWLWTYENPTHANVQPLPWDINYQPKPAYYQMLAVLQDATGAYL